MSPHRAADPPYSILYMWFRNGMPIANSYHSFYNTGKADQNHTLTCRITYKFTGHTSVVILTNGVLVK